VRHRARVTAATTLVALLATMAGIALTATQAGAMPPNGTVEPLGNRSIPLTTNTVSCWRQYLTSSVMVNCYRYNVYGNVLSHDQYNLPKTYCNFAAWRSGGSYPKIDFSNSYFTEYPGFPVPTMNGGAPGCGVGLNQNGSQGWAGNYTSPVPCGNTGQPSCTAYVGQLAGGSWWNSPGVSRTQACGYAGIACRYGYSYFSTVQYTQ
jgi:hypothetical protein